MQAFLNSAKKIIKLSQSSDLLDQNRAYRSHIPLL